MNSWKIVCYPNFTATETETKELSDLLIITKQISGALELKIRAADSESVFFHSTTQ